MARSNPWNQHRSTRSHPPSARIARQSRGGAVPATAKAHRSILIRLPAERITGGGAGGGPAPVGGYRARIVNPDNSTDTLEPVVTSGRGPFSSISRTGVLPGAARMMRYPEEESKSRV